MAELALSELMPETDHDTSYGVEREYRIALLGRTGTGKSATGNHILGEKVFESKMCGSSVTTTCNFRTAERFGKKLVVVDTPGLFDTGKTNEEINKEIVKCVGILTPGPHVFILVVEPKRFTPEEQATVQTFSEIFGDEFFKYLVVLFSRRDELENNDMTIDDYVKQVPEQLKNVLQKCDQKYVAFDNSKRGMKDEEDVTKLIRMIQDILQKTGKSYYSNEMFEKAEQEFQQRAEEIRLKAKLEVEQKKQKLDEDMDAELTKFKAQKTELEVQRKEVKARRIEIQAMEVDYQKKSEELERAREDYELDKKKSDAIPREIEARGIEIQAMEEECQAKYAELTEARKKQQEAEKQLEAKEKYIKSKEDTLKKLQMEYNKQLEEQKRQYQNTMKEMRDNDRKEVSNGLFVNILKKVGIAIVATVNPVLGAGLALLDQFTGK